MTITVHIIPHSHTDPGWLNTYDMYYGRDVKPILNSVIKEMEARPNRTFAWSETCFFARWYGEQSARRRAAVQRMVASGQLEFVGAGWVQHDEALPTVSGMLESMAEGHAWLLSTFGVRPSVGWQLDPFGHSAASTALLGRMGLGSVVINRINYNLKNRWRSARHLEFAWAGVAPSLRWGGVLTHVLHTHYSTPKGLDFEGYTRPDVRASAAKLRAVVQQRAEAYRTRELMVLVGDDFRWHKANPLYTAWEALLEELNGARGHQSIRAVLSTPSRYFAALAAARPSLKTPLPAFTGDLLPYADNRESFWTGFYASRPTIKRLVRTAEAAVISAQLLYMLAKARLTSDRQRLGKEAPRSVHDQHLVASWFETLVRCRRSVAIVQHHDAITGTMRSNVLADYLAMLRDAQSRALVVAAAAAARLLQIDSAGDAATPPLSSSLGSLLEPSQPRKDGKSKRARSASRRGVEMSATPAAGETPPTVTPLVVFNALPTPRCEPLQLRLRSPTVTVLDAHGRLAASSILPPAEAAASGQSEAASEPPPLYPLWIRVCVPPLGLATLFVHASSGAPTTSDAAGGASNDEATTAEAAATAVAHPPKYWGGDRGGPPSLSVRLRGDRLDADVDGRSGMLRRLHLTHEGRALGLRCELLAYRTHKSGAYIMRVDASAEPLIKGAPGSLAFHRTPLVHELNAHASRSHSIATRIFRQPTGEEARSPDDLGMLTPVEMELSVYAPINREVVLRLTADVTGGGGMQPANAFFTHDGLAWRRRANPPGEEDGPPSPAAAFFPTSVGAALHFPANGTAGRRLFLLFDRSVGIARISTHGDGGVELLLHRSLNQDDGRGLMGPSIDDDPAKLKLRLLWGAPTAQVLRTVDEHAFAMQAPLLPLRAECPATQESTAGGDECATAYAARYRTSLEPVKQTPPWPLAFWPRPVANDSSEILLRVQRPCDFASCGDGSVIDALRQLLRPPYRLHGLHEVGLTGGPLSAAAAETPPVSVGGAPDPSSQGPTTTTAQEASQNSDESGVFVSDSALALANDADSATPRRRLLAHRSRKGAKAELPPADFGALALEVRAFACTLDADDATSSDAGDATNSDVDAVISKLPQEAAAMQMDAPSNAAIEVERHVLRGDEMPRSTNQRTGLAHDTTGATTLVLRRSHDTSAPSLLLLPVCVGLSAAAVVVLYCCTRRRRGGMKRLK